MPMHEYHYKVHSFCPNRDIMSVWSFSIELDYQYARKLVAVPLKPEHYDRLNEMAAAAQAAIFHDHSGSVLPKDLLKDYQRRPTYGFWENTCLLTNMCVEPGNACGLDMDWGMFEEVKKGTGSEYARVMYNPHNVDSIYQATALLSVFTIWYDHLDALTKP